MAAIDSLLRVMTARGAESLTVASGQVPALRRRGEQEPLSMPALDASLVEVFLSEVLCDERREVFSAEGRLETIHASEAGRFAVRLRRVGEGVEMVFRQAAEGAKSGRTEPPRPVAQVAPAAVSPPPPAPAVAAEPVAGAANLDELLRRAEANGASDVIVTTGQSPRLRIDGELIEVDDGPTAEADILGLVGERLGDEDLARLHEHGSLDLSLDHRSLGGLRYRVNLFRQQRGLAAALRPIRTTVPTLRELGLPPEVQQIVEVPHGLVLITGPAGSGKSTTMVALTEHLNRTRSRHIITLEDPIEYEYQSQRSLIHQREVGAHVDSFGAGLRAALRESPDVIVLGEMRDLDTIAAALTAAETGHLIISTLHCNRAADAIDRMIDIFPGHQQRQARTQLASVLRAVVTQFLLPAATGEGRIPAMERLIVNPAVAAMIRDDKCHQIQSQIQTGRDAGMMPLDRHLAELVRAGRVTMETACRVTTDPDGLRALAGGR